MPVIQIDVLDGFVDVSVNEYAWRKRLEDSLRTVRRPDGGREALDIGGIYSSKPRPPNRASEVKRVFDERHFDPDVAEVYVRYCSMAWLNDLPVARGISASFRRRHVRLTWPGWEAVAPAARRAFVESLATYVASLSINGRTVATKPLYRALLNLGPDLQADRRR